jgi:hypothetical protein
MKRFLLAIVAASALAFTGTAAAALTPWTFVGSGASCQVVSTFHNGVLHLEKNCATSTNASAGATITGVGGMTFSSASFTLANTGQCQGGSPRFNVVTTSGATTTTFFLGCNNVTPTINADGTATYTFTPATIAAAGNQVPFPTGTVKSIEVLIDVQGSADLTKIMVNGQLQSQIAGGPTSKAQCKHGGWRAFVDPSFKNQGQCVSWFEHHHRKHHKHHG